MHTLTTDKKLAVLNALLEGLSIRATQRLTGVTKRAIMRLLVQTGEHCEKVMDNRMRDIRCTAVELDECWTFVGKRQVRMTDEDKANNPEWGDQFTFVAFDPDSKLVPSFLVGRRSRESTFRFVQDLRNRVVGRVQVSTDGWIFYSPAIEAAFGADVDYAQIDKHYDGERTGVSRYSPPRVASTTKRLMWGDPDPARVCTSYVERNNLTLRMQIRRLTRLTNAFSKKLRNLKAAIALFFAHYNLCRIHGSLRVTPAMAANVSDHVWSLNELLNFRVA